MRRQCSGLGLMQAGVIVSVIGLILIARATLDIPGYWTTFLVGAAPAAETRTPGMGPAP